MPITGSFSFNGLVLIAADDELLAALVVVEVDVLLVVVFVAVVDVVGDVVVAGVAAIFKPGQFELSSSHLHPTKILKPIPISSLHLHRNNELGPEALLSIDIRMSTYQVCIYKLLCYVND